MLNLLADVSFSTCFLSASISAPPLPITTPGLAVWLELSQGTLAPVRSAGTNGKKPALPVAFWEYVKEPDYGDVSEKLDFKLHPLLHTTYYRKQLRIQILKNVYN